MHPLAPLPGARGLPADEPLTPHCIKEGEGACDPALRRVFCCSRVRLIFLCRVIHDGVCIYACHPSISFDFAYSRFIETFSVPAFYCTRGLFLYLPRARLSFTHMSQLILFN